MLMRVVSMDPNDCRLLLWINCICGLWMLLCGGNYWCDMDTGPATISDSQGHEHTIYVSRTRDGSSWLRFGKDQQSIDWTYHDEARSRLQGSLIDPETISLLKSLNYTDYCVLTDLDMKVKSYSAWQPTYLVVYDPVARTTPIIHMKHQKECLSNTTFTMSEDKQGLSCDGGSKHVCGQRSLPEKGQQTATFFLKDINFDPVGDEFWVCKERNGSNVYTFIGSYYHAYVKVASCDIPQNSRLFGHEAKLRPNKDSSENMAVIPDPTQTAMSDGIVIGWQFFIKITSIQHSVYLQIWRPIQQHQHHLYQSYDGVYTLVGQTFVKSEDLRYQDVPLDPVGYIHIRKGDLLGFYHPQQNPLPWSSVPCAYSDQIHRFAVETGSEMKIGQTLTFGRAPRGQLACRHYSFTAVLANSSNSKLIEDWSCPDPQKPYVRNRANVSGTSLVLQTSSSSSAAAAAVNRSPMVSVSENDPAGPADQTLSFHLALIVAGCLIILLLIVGIVSYCLAMKL